MEAKTTFQPFLVSTLVLCCIGWGGSILLISLTLPTIWPRWGFFFLFTMGWIGIALPMVYFLNLRFPSTPPAGVNVILRQAIWAGVYWSTLAWLQLGRIATIWTVIGLGGGLVALEYLIRMRERSQWIPPAGDETVPKTGETHSSEKPASLP